MQIEGKNAVAEAVKAGQKIENLYLEKTVRGAAAQELIDAVRGAGGRVEFAERERLDRMSESKRHQGWIAVAAEYEYVDWEEITAPKSGPRLILLLDGIADPHNLGAILRVAECGGADGVILPERRAAGVNETVIRVAAGATAHVKVARTRNLNDAIRRLKESGMRVVGAELGGTPLYGADLRGDLALVVGSEGEGLHRLTRELCDEIVTIPMFGAVNSLNASVACGVVLYEAIRQRNA